MMPNNKTMFDNWGVCVGGKGGGGGSGVAKLFAKLPSGHSIREGQAPPPKHFFLATNIIFLFTYKKKMKCQEAAIRYFH